jgi:pilus assembly protein CpaB
MILRIVLVGLLALGLAGFGTVAWLDLHPTKPHAVAVVQPVEILAAAQFLHAGSLIQPANLTAAAFKPGAVPAGAVKDTPANRSLYTGAMVRQSLAANAPILPGAVIRPGDHGFLAAVLHPGMRAVSVGVDAVTGTAGLIWPGDRVDLLLTQSLSGANLPPGRQVAAETVLSNVRVIATDQRLVQGARSDNKSPGLARTVTLEVTPEQAERVAVAAHLGPLSLVVRSSQSGGDIRTSPPPPVWGNEVSPALAAGTTPTAATPDRIAIYQGPSQKTEFTPQ